MLSRIYCKRVQARLHAFAVCRARQASRARSWPVSHGHFVLWKRKKLVCRLSGGNLLAGRPASYFPVQKAM
jgi:hypothetical protein